VMTWGATRFCLINVNQKDKNLKSELSGTQNPQRNGKVGIKFQTFFGRIRAMLNSTGVKYKLRSGI
jgi:hypothetical protein